MYSNFSYILSLCLRLHRVLVGKPEGNRPPGRPRQRWGNNIKMDFKRIGWECVVKINVVQGGEDK